MKNLNISFFYLQELIFRIIYTSINALFLFILSYRYKQTLIYLILPKGAIHFICTDITEIFIIYVQVSLIISLVISIKIALIQFYLFLRPGLYRFEAEQGLTFLVIYITLYLSLYFVIYPLMINISWNFFSFFADNFQSIQLTLEPKLGDYIKHIKKIGITVNFLFPTLILSIIIINHIKTKHMIKHRKFVYVIALFLATLATPPDCVSQMLLGLFIIKLYEVQLLCKLILEQYKTQVNLVTNRS